MHSYINEAEGVVGTIPQKAWVVMFCKNSFKSMNLKKGKQGSITVANEK